MPCHRQLLPRREDAHPRVGVRLLWRQHEGGLGEAHLLCNRLHRVRGQAPAVEDDGELVAAEEMVGEDIVVKIPV